MPGDLQIELRVDRQGGTRRGAHKNLLPFTDELQRQRLILDREAYVRRDGVRHAVLAPAHPRVHFALAAQPHRDLPVRDALDVEPRHVRALLAALDVSVIRDVDYHADLLRADAPALEVDVEIGVR